MSGRWLLSVINVNSRFLLIIQLLDSAEFSRVEGGVMAPIGFAIAISVSPSRNIFSSQSAVLASASTHIPVQALHTTHCEVMRASMNARNVCGLSSRVVAPGRVWLRRPAVARGRGRAAVAVARPCAPFWAMIRARVGGCAGVPSGMAVAGRVANVAREVAP